MAVVPPAHAVVAVLVGPPWVVALVVPLWVVVLVVPPLEVALAELASAVVADDPAAQEQDTKATLQRHQVPRHPGCQVPHIPPSVKPVCTSSGTNLILGEC